MSIQSDAADGAVGRVLDVVDIVADQYDVDAEGLLTEALGRVRQRGADDE